MLYYRTQWFGTVFYEEKENKSFWRVLQAFAVASSLLYYRVVYQQIIYVVRSTVGFYGFIDHVHHHHFLSGQWLEYIVTVHIDKYIYIYTYKKTDTIAFDTVTFKYNTTSTRYSGFEFEQLEYGSVVGLESCCYGLRVRVFRIFGWIKNQ